MEGGQDAFDISSDALEEARLIYEIILKPLFAPQPVQDAVIEALKDAIECAWEHKHAYTEISEWKRKFRRAVAVLDALGASRPATQPQESKG